MSLTGGQPNFARSLVISWAGTLCIHFWGLLLSDGILPCAELALRLYVQVLRSPIGIVTAWHSSSGRQPSIAAWYKEWNY